jgi:long-subunit acyl-CoA synthetase (AMP-forming)/alkylation response protein AidB-like acyl-CoA dehydrogenase
MVRMPRTVASDDRIAARVGVARRNCHALDSALMNPPAARSLVDLLAVRVANDAERLAVVTPSASRHGSLPVRNPAGWSWRALAARALRLAEWLGSEGLAPGDRLAHIGPHTADWVITDLACLLAGIVHVPLHADMPVETRRQWCEWLSVKAMLMTGRGCERNPTMPCPLLDWQVASDQGLHQEQLLSTAEITGRLADCAEACDPDAEAVILFSSGTTGRGRAVVHSQRSLAENAAAAAAVFLEEPDDVRLAWLPLSHSLARTGDLGTALVRGACLAMVEDRTRVLEAAREVSPTVILGVPAFYERIEHALACGRITDLSASLGGRVRVCVSGGAPLRQRTAAAFAKAGVPLVEGYGLAEAGPVVSLASPRNCRAGTVGPPITGVQVRCNEQGIFEVKSPGLALGVIDAGEQLRRPIAQYGWLTTGDRGSVDADGHLRIAGRAVDVLTLASGEKIPPADIEAALAEDRAIAQVCLIGDGLRRPLAVIVPEPDVLREAVRLLKLRVASRQQALRHPRLLAWLARRVAWRQQHLPRAWQAGHLLLLGRSFDPDRGEVTVSMKLRRHVIAEKFTEEMTAMTAIARQESQPLPAGVAAVKASPPPAGSSTPAANCLWQPASAGGFAAAAEAAAAALPDAIHGIQDEAIAATQRMRDDGSLFDEAGRLSTTAEAALAATGLFGLAVPVEHGGNGGGMHQLCRVVSSVGGISPTAAGMLSVHSTIGAVWALRDFGSPQQQQRHLPGLARGAPLSIFAATEPDAGCDLGRVATTLETVDGRLLISGHKLYITGATHGRLVKLLARDSASGNRPVVILVRLPPHDTPQLRLERCPLHPLKHAHNQAILFDGFEADPADILQAPVKPGREPDAMQIVWHGLNRGRVTLAAQAVGTLSLMLNDAVSHSRLRETWGQPIASRELVQGRVARIAAAAVACEALASWAAHAIDAGGSGELEAITAKVTASGLVRDAATDAYGIHGGRGFLLGHPLGDALHDHFAVNTYEGESGLLELALFKGLARRHPFATSRGDPRSKLSMLRLFADRVASRWTSAQEDRTILHHRFRLLALAARRGLVDSAWAVERSFREHGRDLAERQLLVGNLASRVRDQLTILAVAHHADRVFAPRSDTPALAAAETACRLALARSQGRHLTAADLSCLATTGKRFLSTS